MNFRTQRRPLQLTAVIMFSSLLLWLNGCSSEGNNARDSAGQDGASATDASNPDGETDAGDRQLKKDWEQQLVGSGWKSDAAAAVIELNAESLLTQYEESPDKLLQQSLKLLKSLGRYPDVQPVLVSRPEVAFLLANSREPRLVGQAFSNMRDETLYRHVVAMFSKLCGFEDSVLLAEALDHHRDLMCRVTEALPGGEVFFVFDRSNPDVNEYDRWLAEFFEQVLSGADERFGALVSFVEYQGPDIRRRILNDAEFRRRFREELWPAFVRVVSQQHDAYEMYIRDEHVWDLLLMPNGEQLLLRCNGIATRVLFGDPDRGIKPYPKDLHPTVTQILLRGDTTALGALAKYQDEPLFQHLLRRNLPTGVLLAAFKRLEQAGPKYPSELAMFHRLADNALTEELGPEPSGLVTWIPLYYTVWEVPKKLLQGRDVSGLDAFQAALDPALFLIPVAGKLGSIAAKEGTEQVAKKVLITQLKNKAIDLAARKVGQEAVAKMTAKELADWTTSAALANFRKAVASQLSKMATVEITAPVQLFFRKLPAGRAALERVTKLGARLFMRGDARVFIRLDRVPSALADALGPRGTLLVKEFLGDIGINAALETDTAHAVIREGARVVAAGSREIDRVWKQNIATWWWLNAIAPQTP